MQMPDMQFPMLVKKPTRRSMRILTYRLANQLRRENTDVVGDKPVKIYAGEMSMSKDSKQKAGQRTTKGSSTLSLTGTQTTCLTNHQWKARPSQSPLTWLRKKAISQMKADKAVCQKGIVVEMIRAASDMGASMIHDLAAVIIPHGKVLSDWEQFHCLLLQG